MFGLMEITAQFDEATKLAIIPTFILPFTIVGMVLTGIATWIAAFFGIQLKAEGPKRLFEVLMKPKVLALALVSNVFFYGLYLGWGHISNGPYPLWWVKVKNSSLVASEKSYSEFSIQDKVVIPAQAGKIQGFKTVWEYPLKDLVFGTPAVSGDSIFFSGVKGRVTELKVDDGQLIRQFEIGQPVTATPLIVGQRLFVGEGIHLTHHARLYSFDLQAGQFLGAYSTAGHIERAATLARAPFGAAVIFPAGKDGIYAVDPVRMTKLWQAPVGHVDSIPVSDGKKVYVGTGVEKGFPDTQTKAFALDVTSGKVLWSADLASSSWGIPTLWENLVCFSAGDVYEHTDLGQISCHDTESGNKEFEISIPGALIGQPLVVEDRLLISDLQGVVYQINLREKKIEWSLKVPTAGQNYSSIVLDSQDRLIVPGKEGIYVYSRTTQELLNIWKPEGEWKGVFTNIVIHKDLWIISDRSGWIRAVRPYFW